MKELKSFYIKLEDKFFTHAKVDLLIEKHGVAGAYCLLAIWSEMMVRGGTFDTKNEYDVLAIARRSRLSSDEVLKVIKTCAKVALLTEHGSSGVYQKDRISDNIQQRNDLIAAGRAGGKASGEVRRNQAKNKEKTNDRSTTVEAHANGMRSKERKKERSIDNSLSVGERELSTDTHSVVTTASATDAPLWARLALRYQIPDVNDVAKKIIEGRLREMESTPGYQEIIQTFEAMNGDAELPEKMTERDYTPELCIEQIRKDAFTFLSNMDLILNPETENS